VLPTQQPSGWRSRHGQTPDGAVEAEQLVDLAVPVVEFTEEGAYALARAYWEEVERSTLRFVRRAGGRRGVQLCVLGRGPALLAFGSPEVVASETLVRCRYPITGGFLARLPQGELTFEQTGGDRLRLSSSIRGFLPTLAARRAERHWTGALYDQVQSRLHVYISRRFFARLTGQAQP